MSAILEGLSEKAELTFEDVKDEWYKPYIETAFAMDVIKGISETEFGVGNALTREDAAVMIVRASEAMYKTLNKKVTLVNFTDYDAVSDYAKVAVDMLARAEVINGFEDGSFQPQNKVTRAEIAKMIYTYLNNING